MRAKVVIPVLIAIGVGALLLYKRSATPTDAGQRSLLVSTQGTPAIVSQSPTNLPTVVTNPLGTIRAAQLSEREKEELAKKFEHKFKPAITKWFSAYGDRIPFRPNEITLDKFVERLGDRSSFCLYTFVLGDITFTIQESNDAAKVSYLASRKATLDMNKPSNGETPKTDLPVNREEVTQMVKVDTGTAFPPNEILMSPTGIAFAMNGGANVRIGPPKNAPPAVSGPDKLDMVFDQSGKLVYYMRDPFF